MICNNARKESSVVKSAYTPFSKKRRVKKNIDHIEGAAGRKRSKDLQFPTN